MPLLPEGRCDACQFFPIPGFVFRHISSRDDDVANHSDRGEGRNSDVKTDERISYTCSLKATFQSLECFQGSEALAYVAGRTLLSYLFLRDFDDFRAAANSLVMQSQERKQMVPC